MPDKPDPKKKPSDKEYDRGRGDRGGDRTRDEGGVKKRSTHEEPPKPPPTNRRVPPGHKP